MVKATGGETDGPLKNGLTRNVRVESQSKKSPISWAGYGFLVNQK